MVFSLYIVLCLAPQLLLGVKSSMVTLSDNGYDGIVIAINPSVPEDEKLIQNIKEMVLDASTYLFNATKRRVYFRNVSILIPMTWKSKPEYLMPKQESYEQADVVVAEPYLKFGDDPYTLQYGQCGQKGQYIHLTPKFLLTDPLPIYGPRGKVFVHEWAHLRWGVFDEYNTDQPFYVSRRNTMEATRCSTNITGIHVVLKACQRGTCDIRPCERDPHSGLYEAKCTFIPEKSQTAKESIMFMQNFKSVAEFCTAETHNTEAPNLHNKMCHSRSTWDIIMASDDFQNVSPMADARPPAPTTFSLLRSKQRTVCLVLDKSGSMDTDDRLILMNQAAELYLIQIIEKGSLVGMVTFDAAAKIQNNLTLITGDNAYQSITENLPERAGGGTSICDGLKAGFRVITGSHQSTSGSEIILLTDGEDTTMGLCFEEVKQSGAIIHTIALGPSAAKELETLAQMTGGYSFYIHKDTTGLIDAFSRISSRSGSILHQAVQVESKAFNISGSKWMNGTVPVDSTIGNDTFFVVTWTIQKPEIFLQDPKGKKYKTSDFKEDKLNIRSTRLRIPGIAESGTWIYSLLNNHINSQLLTVTVTTRARSPTTLPVIATAHMSQNTAHYPSLAIVYARVSQGFLPVLGINVTAIIENENGHKVKLDLWDNGAGADTVKNDGIYSRYFKDYHGNGRYSLKVRAHARKNTARLHLKQHHNKAMYIPGYVENGTIVANPFKPEVAHNVLHPGEGGDVNRVVSGGAFIVSGVPANSAAPAPVFPPIKITDLEAKFKGDRIHLSWTAPGNNLDEGKGNRYVLRISKHFQDLQAGFDKAALVNTSSLTPKEAGSEEVFEFKPECFTIENGTKFHFAIKAINDANLTSEISNIAQATKFTPPRKPNLGTSAAAMGVAVWGLAVFVSLF
ncbi:calcium-activated chloride channel regulator 1-like [Echinops telfairi]|uniref:Calcium-activated chloride channel regulator 1-like n=1 Tax=Echinops telfairi TaxID=9371 RepID=A0AC55D8A9_ECHTE|nr:calcium-activated chloride channel regulator 1-like [Echinops telfairi]